jgi:hypothetical protein
MHAHPKKTIIPPIELLQPKRAAFFIVKVKAFQAEVQKVVL